MKKYSVGDAREALSFCDAGKPRQEWVRVLAAAKAAGLDFADVLAWSETGGNFKDERDVADAWRSLRDDGGVGAGTLFHIARDAGWKPQGGANVSKPARAIPSPHRPALAPQKPPKWRAADLWDTGIAATADHGYIARKSGIPDGLRICTEHVHIGGQDMHGALMVPVQNLETGNLVSLQLIPEQGQKMSLPGHRMAGAFIVCEVLDVAGVAYVCEGIGQAWAAHIATDKPAVVCFGWGSVRARVSELRRLHPKLSLVLVPDRGKEDDAAAIAAEFGCQWVELPGDLPSNYDINDYLCDQGADGPEKLADLLDKPLSPALPEPSQAVPRPEFTPPVADWAGGRDGTGDTHPLTEGGNALRMMDLYGDSLRYLYEWRKWLLWSDGRWALSDDSLVGDLALNLYKVIYQEAARHSREGAHFAAWARQTQTLRVTDATVSLLAKKTPIRLESSRLDADPMLCGLDGGRKVLDLRTGKARPAKPGDYIAKSLAVSYLGEASKAVRWRQFIDEVTCNDAELADWLQRLLGYCLTGSTAEQFFVFAFGHGANGKSVLTETMRELMGSYGCSLQPATLCDTRKSATGASPDLAALEGIRFAVAPEAEEGSRFHEPTVKTIVSGDMMTVRRLHCPPHDIKPCPKLFVTGNHKPQISGMDTGIWRRVRLVPFNANFEGRADRQLPDKLRAEFPHILAWLVHGCQEWQARGLSDTPAAIKQATDAYREENDVLGAWLEDRCTRGPNAEAPTSTLYASYQEWALANGITRPWALRMFARKLGEYRLNGWQIGERKGAGGVRLRTGIALRHVFSRAA